MIEIHINRTKIVITCLAFDDYANSHVVEGACDLLEPFRQEIGAPAFDFGMDDSGVAYVGMMEHDADGALVIENLPCPRPAWFDAAIRELVHQAIDFRKGRTGDLVPARTIPPARRTPVVQLASDVPHVLTTKQLCHVLHASRMTLYRWCRCGKLPAPVKVGGRNRWRYAEVVAFFGCLKPVNSLPSFEDCG